jgi:hypothetical protein
MRRQPIHGRTCFATSEDGQTWAVKLERSITMLSVLEQIQAHLRQHYPERVGQYAVLFDSVERSLGV